MNARWYAVQTQPRNERLAFSHLSRQGFHGFLPEYLKRRSHARKVDWVPSPLFPGYLFVNLDIGAERWRAINGTVGVQRIVCQGDEPAAVPDVVIKEIKERRGNDGMVLMPKAPRFVKGQTVQIISGLFCDQSGIFDCESGKERVFVLLNLLGREVRVRVSGGTLAEAV